MSERSRAQDQFLVVVKRWNKLREKYPVTLCEQMLRDSESLHVAVREILKPKRIVVEASVVSSSGSFVALLHVRPGRAAAIRGSAGSLVFLEPSSQSQSSMSVASDDVVEGARIMAKLLMGIEGDDLSSLVRDDLVDPDLYVTEIEQLFSSEIAPDDATNTEEE
jgi:hypothetical protein